MLAALLSIVWLFGVFQNICVTASHPQKPQNDGGSSGRRERMNLNDGWRFRRWEENPDGVIYDYRKDLENLTDVTILKPWILPSGNHFILNDSQKYEPPPSSSPPTVSFARSSFDDQSWANVSLPHDWAIAGPFYTEPEGETVVGGGMGRLPVFGVGWYRRKLELTEADAHRQIYLDIEGAMSYAMVWLNGELIGGWPYPYNSFRLDLTPHLHSGSDNQIAIRLDNPVDSARWYPGGGLYRDVWLTKLDKTHVGLWGTRFTTANVSDHSAHVMVEVHLESEAESECEVSIETEIFTFNDDASGPRSKVQTLPKDRVKIGPRGKIKVHQSANIHEPMLWGPHPAQSPNLYIGVARLLDPAGKELDRYETTFGIRNIEFDGNRGLLVNGEHVPVRGVNQHHDLGAIGAAFNVRAAERQLQILQEMGVNAIRTAHNPPAPALLDLTDRMGFLVFEEVFDSWYRNKTDNDFHLIFGDWHEQDIRSMIRRDRNHASVIVWSFGNEVGEQHYKDEGPVIGARLHSIVREEDPTRPSTSSMNYAQPGNNGSLFPTIMDVHSLNYQGEGIRDTINYSNTSGIQTPPAFPLFHEAYPDKLVWSSESASTVSTRGTYFFPVTSNEGAPVNDSSGGSEALAQVSAYELYSANFGSSPDKAFAELDRNPYAGGEFVWTGFDYIGEPTPYYSSRSSYSGIVDLAGFKKDRFFLYQARWRPDLPMVHILPHWNWPCREGQVTPVHVFTSGDGAELFLNGRSLGRRALGDFEYRLRWDEVIYEAGELVAISYKGGQEWARAEVHTTGPAAALQLTVDRRSISCNGVDLAYITAEVVDANGTVVPTAENAIGFSASEDGTIVATDNGDPADLVAFPSLERHAFSGRALAIVKGASGNGTIAVRAESEGLEAGMADVRCR